MKPGKIAIFAILLWIVTIVVFAWFFIRGNTVAGTDHRTAIVLKVSERDFVLGEMRAFLSATHEILEGLDRGDRNQVIRSSRSVGMASATDVSPALMGKLPLPFKTLGMSVHKDMDELAKAAESGKPAPELQKMLNSTLSKCIACHASWQFEARN